MLRPLLGLTMLVIARCFPKPSEGQTGQNPVVVVDEVPMHSKKHPIPFYICGSQVVEIKNAFRRRIEEARAEDDGSFLNTHMDLMKIRDKFLNGKPVLVVDVGGTNLKIVELICRYQHCSECPCDCVTTNGALKFFKYPDTSCLNDDEKPKWNDWVADKVLEFYEGKLPEESIAAALTFSYPLEQSSIDCARVSDLVKNFSFRHENTQEENIVEVFNDSLRTRGIRATVTCVLNDSAATFMAGMLRNYDNTIGIVLGTGTNASFVVTKNDGSVVLYNSEWGSTEIPRSLLSEADLDVIRELEASGTRYHIVDVLAGGYKFFDIILNQLRLSYPELYQRYKDKQEIIGSILDAINASTNSRKEIWLRRDRQELHDALRELVLNFRFRGMAILGGMIGAILESSGMRKAMLILNGSVFSSPHSLSLLNTVMRTFYPDIHFEMAYLPNASLEGAAFASMMYSPVV